MLSVFTGEGSGSCGELKRSFDKLRAALAERGVGDEAHALGPDRWLLIAAMVAPRGLDEAMAAFERSEKLAEAV